MEVDATRVGIMMGEKKKKGLVYTDHESNLKRENDVLELRGDIILQEARAEKFATVERHCRSG